jgi:hypothetical protein
MPLVPPNPAEVMVIRKVNSWITTLSGNLLLSFPAWLTDSAVLALWQDQEWWERHAGYVFCDESHLLTVKCAWPLEGSPYSLQLL